MIFAGCIVPQHDRDTANHSRLLSHMYTIAANKQPPTTPLSHFFAPLEPDNDLPTNEPALKNGFGWQTNEPPPQDEIPQGTKREGTPQHRPRHSRHRAEAHVTPPLPLRLLLHPCLLGGNDSRRTARNQKSPLHCGLWSTRVLLRRHTRAMPLLLLLLLLIQAVIACHPTSVKTRGATPLVERRNVARRTNACK